MKVLYPDIVYGAIASSGTFVRIPLPSLTLAKSLSSGKSSSPKIPFIALRSVSFFEAFVAYFPSHAEEKC
jgi:hypothetical protein